MKKYLRLSLFTVFLLLSTNRLLAECPPWVPPNECSETGAGDGDGARKVPIDDYTPILIITAITIAGLISYKQRELLRK